MEKGNLPTWKVFSQKKAAKSFAILLPPREDGAFSAFEKHRALRHFPDHF